MGHLGEGRQDCEAEFGKLQCEGCVCVGGGGSSALLEASAPFPPPLQDERRGQWAPGEGLLA